MVHSCKSRASNTIKVLSRDFEVWKAVLWSITVTFIARTEVQLFCKEKLVGLPPFLELCRIKCTIILSCLNMKGGKFFTALTVLDCLKHVCWELSVPSWTLCNIRFYMYWDMCLKERISAFVPKLFIRDLMQSGCCTVPLHNKTMKKPGKISTAFN